jgi:hypothetical protein
MTEDGWMDGWMDGRMDVGGRIYIGDKDCGQNWREMTISSDNLCNQKRKRNEDRY